MQRAQPADAHRDRHFDAERDSNEHRQPSTDSHANRDTHTQRQPHRQRYAPTHGDADRDPQPEHHAAAGAWFCL